ncbi:protein transport protein SFT2 [Lipomyces japonicus]|uniref:protein transport protein SFT2 n=1 Tax=Lipomyces japonicus TaxID=56871 RepID=UPI0034CD38F2
MSRAESSFRQQLNSWTGRSVQQPDLEPVGDGGISLSAIGTTLRELNPFQSSSSSRYMQLPISENDNVTTGGVQEPSWFALSRWDRLICFGLCLAAALVLFVLCFVLFPVLVLKPRKFALLWSLASLLFVISFGCLQGPVNYTLHLISASRLPFTIAYFGSIILTMTSSLVLRSNVLTLVACVVQIIAAIWYTVSYFPFGTQGLRVASRLGTRRVNAWLDT